jgi:putative transposase
VAVLERLAALRGVPRVIHVDNGPEFASRALDAWAHGHGVKLACSRPGTPTATPCIEACNGRVRQECPDRLDQQWVYSREDARTCREAWRKDSNTIRPPTALGNQTPAAFAAAWHEQQTNRETG